jgi:hypothetical protein
MKARASGIAERALALGVLCLALGAAGCAEVAPWERGRLAKPHMALDPNPGCRALRVHTHMSREAAAGGKIASGGGCGCY